MKRVIPLAILLACNAAPAFAGGSNGNLTIGSGDHVIGNGNFTVGNHDHILGNHNATGGNYDKVHGSYNFTLGNYDTIGTLKYKDGTLF